MSVAITFDTYEFVQELKKAGMPEQQAEAISMAVRKSQANLDVATKQDITHLRTNLHQEITNLKYDFLKWFLGFVVVNFALLVGILFKVMTFPVPGLRG